MTDSFSAARDEGDGSRAIELSFPLPHAPDTKIYLSLTIHESSLLLFLTTATGSRPGMSAPLGSFVYALPDRHDPTATHSSALYTYESSLDFTNRLGRVLARRTGRPVYVGNSMSFASAGLGGTVEEEMAGFRRVVEIVLGEVHKSTAVDGLNGDDAH